MADGAGGRSRGPGGSKHAGVADWHVENDSGHMREYGSVDPGNVSSEGRSVAKKGPGPVGNSALMQVMDNVCHAEFTYGSGIGHFGAVVDIGCILHWLALMWGWSVMAGGSGGGASVPGSWRSKRPAAWTHAARPSH